MVQQNLDEEKSKHAGLIKQNGFGPGFWCKMLRLAKVTAKPNTSCSLAVDWLDKLIGPGGLLLVASHHLQSQSHFYGWRWEKAK
jgi:hypothetical protein